MFPVYVRLRRQTGPFNISASSWLVQASTFTQDFYVAGFGSVEDLSMSSCGSSQHSGDPTLLWAHDSDCDPDGDPTLLCIVESLGESVLYWTHYSSGDSLNFPETTDEGGYHGACLNPEYWTRLCTLPFAGPVAPLILPRYLSISFSSFSFFRI